MKKNVGEYVVYQKDVCEIIDCKMNIYSHQECYGIVPIRDKSLKLNIPVTNTGIRELMTREEVESLIQDINAIPLIDADDKQMENEYKRLLNDGTPRDLIQIIKTTYLRNQIRLENNKKASDKDNRYFELAETYLYNEIATVLGLSYDDAKDYVVTKVDEIANLTK